MTRPNISEETFDFLIEARVKTNELSAKREENLSRLREVRATMMREVLSPEAAIELLREEQSLIAENQAIDGEMYKLQQQSISACGKVFNAVKEWLDSEGVKVETSVRIALRDNLYIELPNGAIKVVIPDENLG